MPLDPWRLRLLESFERVGTVRGVAAELLLSPSTVSQQLGQLEREAGATLFERGGRSLRLTPAGATLAVAARDLRDRLDAMEALLVEVGQGPAGLVRIAGFASSVEPVLVVATAALAGRHPRVEVQVLELEPRESIVALRQGRCELAVTVDEGDGALLGPGIRVVPLARDPLRVVLPAGHRLAGRSSIAIADLAGERWALDAAGSYLGELVPRMCRAAGFEPVVAARLPSYPTLLAHVGAGLSVGVLPALAIQDRPDAVAVPLADVEHRRIVVAVRPATLERAAVGVALDALRAAASG
ncbi:LysR family transcriptional regulator [Galbitalea sp. SE-J8]|uniref:LysR family transcriptional regulator n=1 Tax=Galbitalea sp. SE-J8 TaxID=3054952 RepID=UPI00259D0BDB|nr:LysR family transcriptional regulator [Galbitalea sp. SE-J8]MDM4763702.1 LysR family transcriptional regulator [Galbitalea sp. SE-J8]